MNLILDKKTWFSVNSGKRSMISVDAYGFEVATQVEILV